MALLEEAGRLFRRGWVGLPSGGKPAQDRELEPIPQPLEVSKRLMIRHAKAIFRSMRPWYVAMRRRWMGAKHRQLLQTLRGQDVHTNSLSAPPEDEDVRLVCLWAVEYFPPSYTDDLVAGLSRLGWDKPRFFSDPILGIEKMRERHAGGHMTRLGYFVPKGSARVPGPTTSVARLPREAEYAIADLYAVTPSLHCVVVCFVLKEEVATRFDQALRATHRTEAEPAEGGWQYLPPDHQKAEQLAEIRGDLLQSVADWFRKYLPGLCSSGFLYGEMPTCEGITTRVAEPFPTASERDGALVSYASMLGIGQDYGAWRCRDFPAIKMRFPGDRGWGLQYHTTLAAKEPILAGSNLGGQLMDAEEMNPTHTLVSPWLSTWALLPLAQGYVRLVRGVRDSPALRDADQKHAATILKSLREYLAYSIDIADVASELSTEPVGRFPSAQSLPFDPCSSRHSKLTLLDFLTSKIEERATWVIEREKALRDQIVQVSSLLGTEENIRAQTRMRQMTKWIIGLTIVTTLVAVLSLCVTVSGLVADLGSRSGG